MTSSVSPASSRCGTWLKEYLTWGAPVSRVEAQMTSKRSSGHAPGTAWPDDRYDVIWSFTRLPGEPQVRYAFGQVPQRLLAGDTHEVIPG